jgi:hypothetical protein
LEQWKARCEQRVLDRPADLLRGVLPGGDSLGSPYTWSRAVRVLAIAGGSGELIATIEDPVERGIGLAVAARLSWERGDEAEAEALGARATAVLREVPAYAWKASTVQLDPDGIADHLLPDQRARFEAALARVIGDGAVANPFARRVLRAELLLGYAANAARDGATADIVHTLHGLVGEVLAWPAERPAQRLLANVTAAGLVAAERVVRERTGPIPVPPLAVPDQLYAAVADLRAVEQGLAVHDRLRYALRSLLESPTPAAAAQLAAMAVRYFGDTEAKALAAEVEAAIARVSRGTARARILLTLAGAIRHLDPSGANALLDRARAIAAEDLLPGEHGELTRLLYPQLVAHSPALAAPWLLDAFRERWAQAMSLLDAAAAELAACCGPSLAADLIAAHERARAFGVTTLGPAGTVGVTTLGPAHST